MESFQSIIGKVSEFHQAFRQEQADKPTLISASKSNLRHKLMEEENDEYLTAALTGDKIEILDALADQLYILCGTILKHGLQNHIEEAFNLVHENNMRKLDKDGNPILREDGKIIKPEGFEPVNLRSVFKDEL